MKNGINFFNNASRSHSSKLHKNILSSKKPVDINKKTFLGKKKINNKDIYFNKRYNNVINTKKNFSVSIGDDIIRTSFYRNIDLDKANINEKNLIKNNSSQEYNEIINLLDKIKEKSDSYNILIKIKNFISSLINEPEEKKSLNDSKLNNDDIKNNDIKYNTCKSANCSKIMYKMENRKENEKQENLEEDKNVKVKLNDYEDKLIRNNYLNRRVKKLNNKINLLESKNSIDQLKYLFLIVEQEKKILELEKHFELNEVPLNKRIIEKMRELKCFPGLISNKLNQLSEDEKNNILKSRNKKEINGKFFFDKDTDFMSQKNHSLILTKSENVIKNRKFQFNKKNSNYSSHKNNKSAIYKNKYDNKKSKILINFAKPVNQLFDKKKFFISHPKLNYVKDSIEKNHFLKLKTKEKLNGNSHLLSNMNLSSKSEKKIVNNFSSFINNSMVYFDKIKNN